MRPLRDLPIKQKLLAILVVTGGIGLLLSGLAIVATDSILVRMGLERELSALASIIGDNSTAALAFDDPRAATETLAALKARPHMAAACIYQRDGSVFARYSRPDAPPCPAPGGGSAVRFTGGEFVASHLILLNGRPIGTLMLLYDRGELAERIALYSGIVLLVLVVSSFIGFALSSRLRAVIATPILRLAGAATKVTETGDYSVRVEKESGDELGLLVDAFNGMLEGIQSRDAEIQSARNLLETTLTSIGDAVVSTDLEGRVVFANPVAQSLLGWPHAEIAGKRIGEVFRIVNEFSRENVESPVDKVLREGTIAGLANHTLLIARDGTEVPIDDSAAPIRQSGRTMGVVLVFRDITDRRAAEQDSAYLAAIVESSDDAIIGKSPDGIIQSWNAGAERLFGYTTAEIIGHPMLELLPADRKHEESEILERLRGGQVTHFETVRVGKNGDPIEVSLTISPIRNKEGQIVGISHVARDITEQKRQAAQMRQTQKLESLGVLAGGIAHDFNNLLTGILGNVSLILEDLAPGSPFTAPAKAAVEASERAAQLAQQMLAYSGKGQFVLEQIDLSARTKEILPLIKAAIPHTVELKLDLAEHLPPIEADAAQIQQLIMNIIINAAESIPEGTPGVVAITTRREHAGSQSLPGGTGELAPGPYVAFEVSDTGCGMDEETQARIFDPFFTTKFTGRGLGLAAVLGIVRGHGGSIHVSSTLGKGTVFRILLPASQGAWEAKPAPPEARAAHYSDGGVVLVVDDEEIVRRTAKQALERAGYTVLLAEDGARGVDVYRREGDRLKCVVLDLTMPVMGGEEAVSRMKGSRADIPIILSSGFNEVQAVRRFEGKGLAGFLQKPYKAGVLVETIRRVLAQADWRGAGGPQ